jgi:hypothetical protein
LPALAATALRSRRRALLWTACALSAISAFGLLMNVITLVFEQRVDDPVAAANEALAALGVVLLAATARSGRTVGPPEPSPAPRSARWTLVLRGTRVPRWLPLTPALLGAATLAPYGVAGIGYAALATAGAVTIPHGDFHTSADALLVSWIGLSTFAVYGIALIIAARSYWLRTRRAHQP